MLNYRLKPDGPASHASRRLGLKWIRGRLYSTNDPDTVTYVKADSRFAWEEVDDKNVDGPSTPVASSTDAPDEEEAPAEETLEETPEPESEDETEEPDPDPDREAELEEMDVDELRSLAEGLGVVLAKGYVKKAKLIEDILGAEE